VQSQTSFMHFNGALDQPDLLIDLLQANGPYSLWIKRVFPTEEAYRAVNPHHKPGDALAPTFRADLAYDNKVLMEGAEPILHNPVFLDHASRLYSSSVIVPELIYVNLSAPAQRDQIIGGAHRDTPNFRGLDKDECPYWLLHIMNHSGLFERWQVKTATAVCWYYLGEGGEFWCWPNGPETTPLAIPPAWNTGIMADNDHMFHAPAPCGSPPFRSMDSMTIDATIRGDEGRGWIVENGSDPVASYRRDDVRLALYWRAEVFKDERAREIRDQHLDDLTIEQAIDVLVSDMSRRGVEIDPGEDPVNNGDVIVALSQFYGATPPLVHLDDVPPVAA